MRTIRRLIIHCSDSPDSLDIGAKEIYDWHAARNFSNIGYHYIVRRNGVREPGRPLEIQGAHCRGWNRDSLGICWVGRYEQTKLQKEALLGLVDELRQRFDLPISAIKGHYEYNRTKTCPNLDMEEFRKSCRSYRTSIELKLNPEPTLSFSLGRLMRSWWQSLIKLWSFFRQKLSR